MTGFIEQTVDEWYGSTNESLKWEERQKIVEMVANCVVAGVMDSAVFDEAIKITESIEPDDVGCICKGNWRNIINETEPLIGKWFINEDGLKFKLFGVVHSNDDYYYGMVDSDGVMCLYSCAGDLDMFGFSLLTINNPKDTNNE